MKQAFSLSSWLIAPTEKITQPQTLFWLSLSLIYAAVFGLMALKVAYQNDYSIQDDAQIHVTWLLRYIDPELFPNDFLADYYISSEPYAYLGLYRLFALGGVDAITVSKILPPLLGLITTVYAFLLAFEMLPVPLVGFLASVFLNQLIWNYDTVITATPRAFGALFFLATLYYFVRNSRSLFLGMIVLLGGFYQVLLLPLAGILILQSLSWKKGIPRRFASNRQHLTLCFSGLAVITAILLYYISLPSQYAPIVTKQQALEMIEFQKGGRVEFFLNNPKFYYLYGGRSGLHLQRIFKPKILYLGLLLPILMNYSSYFPLVKLIHRKIIFLFHLVIVSLGLFILAHMTLFKLYLPNRYGLGLQYASRLTTALVLVVLLHAILSQLQNWLKQGSQRHFWKKLLSSSSLIFITSIILISPSHFFKLTHYYWQGKYTQLYQFFEQQPKDIMIASLTQESSHLPSFTKRSVLVAREFAHPYELGYYNIFRERTIDLINAQYSDNLNEVKNFIKKYDVDYFLLDKNAFNSDYSTKSLTNPFWDWLRPFKSKLFSIEEKLDQGMIPLIAKTQNQCTVFENSALFVIDSSCILNTFLDNEIVIQNQLK